MEILRIASSKPDSKVTDTLRRNRNCVP